MPSIYDPARQQELLDRLGALTADRPAHWGRFTAPQMVSHLLEAMRNASGELQIPLRPLPLQSLVRYLAIHVLPLPKGAPTAPEMLVRAPGEWSADLAALRAGIAGMQEPPAGAVLPQHPLFGPMTARDWGALIYKHIDHHLRQFAL